MIALGLRLVIAGGRRAVALAVLTAAAVAVGTALLLFALTVAPAMQARADRTAWANVAVEVRPGDVVATDSTVPYTTVATSPDTYHAEAVKVVLVSGSGAAAPVPPGAMRLPRTGEAMVSPSLLRLMAPDPDFRYRYGKVVGVLDRAALAGPNELLVLQGVQPTAAATYGVSIARFPQRGHVRELTGVVRLLLLLGAVALLAPVALLVALATRLSATTRDRRLAALRLAGATSRQVGALAAVESFMAGASGVLIGTALFFLVRPAATFVTYDGGRWFAADLWPGRIAFVLVLIGVPLVAAVAAQMTLLRVNHSPLGVVRRSKARPVRFWRAIPLMVAVPVLGAALSSDGQQAAAGGHGRVVLGSFVLLLITLLHAGPWITHAAGAWLARTGGPARLLAGRRLADDPRAGFRGVAGVVLTILITTMFAATTPAAAESLGNTRVTGQQAGTAQASLVPGPGHISATLLEQVRSTTGVKHAALVYEGLVQSGTNPAAVWIGDCADIVASTKMVGVPCGKAPALITAARRSSSPTSFHIDNLVAAPAAEVLLPTSVIDPTVLTVHPTKVATMATQTGLDLPDIILSPQQVGPAITRLRPTLLVLTYQGQNTLERVRTLVLRAAPGSNVETRDTTYAGYSGDVRKLYRIMTIATGGAFAVAVLGLLVAVATGLLERRQPFGLLRAAGIPLGTLRRTVLLEACVPLALMSLLAAGLGALTGHWTVLSGGQSTQLPWVELITPVAIGLLGSVCILGCATVLVDPATRTEQTRFD